jgi:hypothetical protein
VSAVGNDEPANPAIPSGHGRRARTLRREYATGPGDAERSAIQYGDLLAELQTAGHTFREGHGTLVEISGAMSDDDAPVWRHGKGMGEPVPGGRGK